MNRRSPAENGEGRATSGGGSTAVEENTTPAQAKWEDAHDELMGALDDTGSKARRLYELWKDHHSELHRVKVENAALTKAIGDLKKVDEKLIKALDARVKGLEDLLPLSASQIEQLTKDCTTLAREVTERGYNLSNTPLERYLM